MRCIWSTVRGQGKNRRRYRSQSEKPEAQAGGSSALISLGPKLIFQVLAAMVGLALLLAFLDAEKEVRGQD